MAKNDSAMTHAASKQTVRETRLQCAPTLRSPLCLILVEPANVEDCGIDFLLSILTLKNLSNPRVMRSSVNCHSFVVRRKAHWEENRACLRRQKPMAFMGFGSYIKICGAGGDGGYKPVDEPLERTFEEIRRGKRPSVPSIQNDIPHTIA
jgi:hypothetical protein